MEAVELPLICPVCFGTQGSAAGYPGETYVMDDEPCQECS